MMRHRSGLDNRSRALISVAIAAYKLVWPRGRSQALASAVTAG
jgi:hypothetical protein